MALTVEKCIQAWTNSLKQMRISPDIIFFGDSLTYYGDFSELFPKNVVCNLGLRGDTLSGMINRVEQVRVLNPKVLFLMAGINDVASTPLNDFKIRFSVLVHDIISSLPDAKVIIQSILPVNSSAFSISCNNAQIATCNSIIREIAEGLNLSYLDLFASYCIGGQLPETETLDGLHIRPECYKKWYDIIRYKYGINDFT